MAIYYVSFKLKKDSCVQEFLLAAKALNDEYISKKKGYVSWQQLRDGDTWADMCKFESVKDMEAFLEDAKTPNEVALRFYSFINLSTCKSHKFSIKVTH